MQESDSGSTIITNTVISNCENKANITGGGGTGGVCYKHWQ
ncbi:MAG: hypothetical protein V8S38_00770 [Lachnospiraceae bacterium]